MEWNLKEAMDYYRRQGAPGDQNTLIALLREVQQEEGGRITRAALTGIAQGYGIKEALLTAIIRRIPSLKLADYHVLELCGGPNCGKHRALAEQAEKIAAASGGKVKLKFVPCMRMCAKGPNLRWDGELHHGATEELLRKLTEKL